MGVAVGARVALGTTTADVPVPSLGSFVEVAPKTGAIVTAPRSAPSTCAGKWMLFI
jgi:hypothetical protein